MAGERLANKLNKPITIRDLINPSVIPEDTTSEEAEVWTYYFTNCHPISYLDDLPVEYKVNIKDVESDRELEYHLKTTTNYMINCWETFEQKLIAEIDAGVIETEWFDSDHARIVVSASITLPDDKVQSDHIAMNINQLRYFFKLNEACNCSIVELAMVLYKHNAQDLMLTMSTCIEKIGVTSVVLAYNVNSKINRVTYTYNQVKSFLRDIQSKHAEFALSKTPHLATISVIKPHPNNSVSLFSATVTNTTIEEYIALFR